MIVGHRLRGSKSALKGIIGEFVMIDYLRRNGFEIDGIEWATLSAGGPIISLKSIFRGGAIQKPYDIAAVKDANRYLIEVKCGKYAELERNQLRSLRALAGTVNKDGTTNIPVIAHIMGSFENGNDYWEIDWKEVAARPSLTIKRMRHDA